MNWKTVTALAATASIGLAIGCGGQNGSTFSTNTSLNGGYDPQTRTGNYNPSMGGAQTATTAGGPKSDKAARTPDANQIISAELTEDGTGIDSISPDSKKSSTLQSLAKTIQVYGQSPDGSKVAFAAETDKLALFVNSTATAEGATGIGDGNFTSFGSVQFTPDGGKVVFTGQIGGEPYSVFVSGIDGKNFKKLDEGDDACISPDGKRVAYSKQMGAESQIFEMNLDGKGSKQVTKSTKENLLPQWSKDGKKIVYTSNQDGPFGAYMIDAKGGKPTKIAAGVGTVYGATFSPDDKRVAFNRISEKADETGIIVANVDGTKPTRVAEKPNVLGPLYWTASSPGAGRHASQPGALSAWMSPRARTLLVPAKMLERPAPKPKVEDKKTDAKTADTKDVKKADGGVAGATKTTGG